MDWYYALNDQQLGPVSEAEFQNLTANGTIQSSTLVWCEGMADWLPLSQVPDAPQGLRPSSALVSGDAVTCPTCGSQTLTSTLIPVGDNKMVCPNCRERYLQQIKEGVDVLDFGELEGELAGFWIRTGAYLIDAVILNIIQYAVGFVVGFVMVAASGSDQASTVEIVASLVGMGVGFAYAIGFLGSGMQATPGMKLLKLQICTGEGGRVSYARATGRTFAAIISALIFGVGYLRCAWDSEKQTLHDKICNTRVIRLS